MAARAGASPGVAMRICAMGRSVISCTVVGRQPALDLHQDTRDCKRGTDPASLYVNRSISRNASTAFVRAATRAIYAKAKTMHPVTAQNLAAE